MSEEASETLRGDACRLSSTPSQSHRETKVEHYVTVFDYGFAPQGLALYESLERYAGSFKLWVISMDRRLSDMLSTMSLPYLEVIDLEDVESEPLRRVKAGRTRREYCWTLTPFLFDVVFESDGKAQRVTYIDADVWLLASVSAIFEEFESTGMAIQITEHAFSPETDVSKGYGRFCVQFLTMNRDTSNSVRKKWQEQCLEWCFAFIDEGRFGDQKYLDLWPEHYPHLVNVARRRSAFLGPWNATRFPYSEGLMYHFHQVRVNYGSEKQNLGNYRLPQPLLSEVYGPYLSELKVVQERMILNGFPPAPQFVVSTLRERIVELIAPVTDPLYRAVRRRAD